MKLTATREDLLAPLQSVIGVVERRQTMPVLANVLLAARDNHLNVTGTDLEVELVATSTASVQQPGDITVPGRKLLDIFRSLPDKASVTLSTDGERVSVRAGRSRSVARPRQVAMALAKELTSHSLPEIGDAFGGRDHTTVLHACKRIKSLRDSEQRIKEDYSNLLRTLAG